MSRFPNLLRNAETSGDYRAEHMIISAAYKLWAKVRRHRMLSSRGYVAEQLMMVDLLYVLRYDIMEI
jgi:hypothetical protein